VVEANIAAMNAQGRIVGDVFNIATHTEISLNEVKEKLEKYLDRKLEVDQKPSREGDIKNIIADISKAQKILGWEPKVSFGEGLKKAVEWYLNR
jgi:nucleoside-diphosphate-sugar epimerase